MARDEAMPNDVGRWGEKNQKGAYARPLKIAGEQHDLAKTPALSPADKSALNAPSGSAPHKFGS